MYLLTPLHITKHLNTEIVTYLDFRWQKANNYSTATWLRVVNGVIMVTSSDYYPVDDGRKLIGSWWEEYYTLTVIRYI